MEVGRNGNKTANPSLFLSKSVCFGSNLTKHLARMGNESETGFFLFSAGFQLINSKSVQECKPDITQNGRVENARKRVRRWAKQRKTSETSGKWKEEGSLLISRTQESGSRRWHLHSFTFLVLRCNCRETSDLRRADSFAEEVSNMLQVETLAAADGFGLNGAFDNDLSPWETKRCNSHKKQRNQG